MNENETIWREVRWSENSLRFTGDMLLALFDLLQGAPVPYDSNPPFPIPTCKPGWPCVTETRMLIRFVEAMRDRNAATANAVLALLDEAEKQGIEEITFRPSQIPAYPEGAGGRQPVAGGAAAKRGGATSKAAKKPRQEANQR